MRRFQRDPRGLLRRARRSRATTLAVSLLVAALVIVPPAALGVVGDFNQPSTSPEAVDGGVTSVVAANLNGDPSTDLAVLSYASGTVTILLGNGSGDFTAAGTSPEDAGDFPTSLAAANLNGDANADLAVVSGGNAVAILLGDGSGNFTAAGTSPETVGSLPQSVAAASFNGDAHADLAVAHESGDVTILLGDGSGNFTAAGTSPEAAGDGIPSIAAANLNGDANADLAVANYNSGDVTILLGDGSGNFTAAGTSPEAAGAGPSSVAAANLNGDANTDLAVANYSDQVTILLGDGSGNFTAAGTSPEAAGGRPISVVAANLNDDSNTDLAVANYNSGDVTILLGDGSGNFTAAGTSPEAAGAGPVSIAAASLGGNASTDLAVANAGSSNISILLNGFTPPAPPPPAAPTHAQYIAQVDPICQAFVGPESDAGKTFIKNLKRLGRVAKSRNAKAFVRQTRRTAGSLDRLVQIDVRLNDQIAAVPPPEADAGTIGAWLNYRREADGLLTSAASALRQVKFRVFLKRFKAAVKADDAARVAISGFGFQVCGVSV